ncbi:MAG: glutamate-cysteine ligase family protein [Armatimonadota bacterium]|nr:glutamate-cysteine ligase family protein [Armatimonadota bacterium]
MKPYSVTLGVEEEVFVLEKGRMTPTLQSLDYLRRLLWSNPRRYVAHSASNFAKGSERKECFMGSIEMATGVHDQIEHLIADLMERRAEFARAAHGGMIVPVGALFTLDSPTNTASSHIHVGVPRAERARVYENLAYFAPVLAVAAANSPWARGENFGLSYRMAQPGCLGPLREDREYRFQDVIISKRLGTIELRVFDPIPEVYRLREVLEAVTAIAAWPEAKPFDRDLYNHERQTWTVHGMTSHVEALWEELKDIYPVPRDLLESPLTNRLRELARDSIEAAYAEAERLWREGTDVAPEHRPHSRLRTLSGLAGYYAVRLPFMAYKGYKEWYG